MAPTAADFGIGENAEIKPAHDAEHQQADRDAAPQCDAQLAAARLLARGGTELGETRT